MYDAMRKEIRALIDEGCGWNRGLLAVRLSEAGVLYAISGALLFKVTPKDIRINTEVMGKLELEPMLKQLSEREGLSLSPTAKALRMDKDAREIEYYAWPGLGEKDDSELMAANLPSTKPEVGVEGYPTNWYEEENMDETDEPPIEARCTSTSLTSADIERMVNTVDIRTTDTCASFYNISEMPF